VKFALLLHTALGFGPAFCTRVVKSVRLAACAAHCGLRTLRESKGIAIIESDSPLLLLIASLLPLRGHSGVFQTSAQLKLSGNVAR